MAKVSNLAKLHACFDRGAHVDKIGSQMSVGEERTTRGLNGYGMWPKATCSHPYHRAIGLTEDIYALPPARCKINASVLGCTVVTRSAVRIAHMQALIACAEAAAVKLMCIDEIPARVSRQSV